MAAPSSLADQQSSSLENTHQYPELVAHLPQLLKPSCNSEILQTHCKVQHRVHTPSLSLTLTYTPPPSAKLLQLQWFPAHPLPADLDAHVITSNMPAHPFHSGMDSHVITCDIAAHPLHADVDTCIMSSIMPDMDAHIIPSDTPAHRLHADMDTQISTPVIPTHLLDVMGDNKGSNDALHERHLFNIWASGFDPVSPHDISSGDISPCDISSIQAIELEQLPSLVPDSPTWAASKFTAMEFLGTCAPTSA